MLSDRRECRDQAAAPAGASVSSDVVTQKHRASQRSHRGRRAEGGYDVVQKLRRWTDAARLRPSCPRLGLWE